MKAIIFLAIASTLFIGCSRNFEGPEVTNAESEITRAKLDPNITPLPDRSGPRIKTTGSVPHVQIGVSPDQAMVDELFRKAYLLPGVENRPTIVSLPGGRGMWLEDEIELANPGAIVRGREFAHLHTDGSLHAPLPLARAFELSEKGWGERHPWAGKRKGFDGFVMLFSPLSEEELEITFQLIVESYNHITGMSIQASDYK